MKFQSKQRRRPAYPIAWLFMAALIGVAALAVNTFMAYRSAAVALLIERDRQVTYLSAARVRGELSKFSDALQTFARTPELYDRNPVIRRQALQESLLVREGVFDGGLILLDNHGRVVATEPLRAEIMAQDWSDREVFRRLLGTAGPIFSNAQVDGTAGPDGAPVIVVSVPVFGERSQFVGALLGVLRLGQSTISPFYAALVRLRIGQGGTTYVIDGNGDILFDSGSRAIGLPYNTSALPGLVIDPQGGAVRMQDADQNEIVAAYAPIPGTDWTLVTEDDWAALTRDTRSYLNLLILLLGAGLLIPAVGVVILLNRSEAQAEAYESAAQGTRVARLIKDSLLPKQAPTLPGWRLLIHHQPGAVVVGDFHDMLLLPDGQLMVTVGNIPAHDVAAAMLLATARATLRGTARCMLSPAEALTRSNEFLCPETPEEITIACFYALLDPARGVMTYANAGYDLAFYRRGDEVIELPASPFYLGAQLDTVFEQVELPIGHGEYTLFCRRELVDTSNAQGELFGVERLKDILRAHAQADDDLAAAIRTALRHFAGDGWSEGMDVTLIGIERLALTPDAQADAPPGAAVVRTRAIVQPVASRPG